MKKIILSLILVLAILMLGQGVILAQTNVDNEEQAEIYKFLRDNIEFLNCDYNSAKEMDLSVILYNGAGISRNFKDLPDNEQEKVTQKWRAINSNIPLEQPSIKMEVDDINHLLRGKALIGLDEFTKESYYEKLGMYVEEYNAYYKHAFDVYGFTDLQFYGMKINNEGMYEIAYIGLGMGSENEVYRKVTLTKTGKSYAFVSNVRIDNLNEFNSDGEEEYKNADKYLSAKGYAGASDNIYYLKGDSLYYYKISSKTTTLIAKGVSDIYYPSVQSDEINVKLNTNYNIYDNSRSELVFIKPENTNEEYNPTQEVINKTFLDWKSAYKDLLSVYVENTIYTLTDINNDGIPELIIKVGENEAEYELHFFTFKDKKIKELGNISGGHCGLYGDSNQNYILKVYGHMGYEIVSHIEIKDGKIVETEVSQRTIGEDEGYTKGDVDLEFCSFDDYKLIDNYQSITKNNTAIEDTTTAKGSLPKTGNISVIIITVAGAVLILIIGAVGYHQYKKKKQM